MWHSSSLFGVLCSKPSGWKGTTPAGNLLDHPQLGRFQPWAVGTDDALQGMSGQVTPDSERLIELEGRSLDLRGTLAPLGKMVARFAEGAWWKAVRTPEGTATVRISRPEREEVLVKAWGEGSEWVCHRAERWVGLADHPEEFVSDHPLVRRLHHLNPGARFGATGLVSEALWAAILAQKVTGREAARSMRALIRQWGEPAPGPQVGVRLLPGPQRLASAGYFDLHPLGLERKRAVTLLRAAGWYGRIEKTADMSPKEARRFLERLPGVGRWSSAETVAVSHGDADAAPVGDYHLKNVVAWHLTGRARGTDEEMMELLEPFRPHRGRVVRLLEKAGKAPQFGPRMPVRDFRHQ